MSTQTASTELVLLLKRLIEAVRARSPRRAGELLLLLLAGAVVAGAGALFRVVRLSVGAVVMLILVNLAVRVVGRLIQRWPTIGR